MLCQSLIYVLISELIQQYSLAFQVSHPGKVNFGSVIQIYQITLSVNITGTQVRHTWNLPSCCPHRAFPDFCVRDPEFHIFLLNILPSRFLRGLIDFSHNQFRSLLLFCTSSHPDKAQFLYKIHHFLHFTLLIYPCQPITRRLVSDSLPSSHHAFMCCNRPVQNPYHTRQMHTGRTIGTDIPVCPSAPVASSSFRILSSSES